MTIKKIFVVGAGTMGNGIAQTAATSGFEVTCMDVVPEALENARAAIGKSTAKLVEKGSLTAEQKRRADAIKFVTTWPLPALRTLLLRPPRRIPNSSSRSSGSWMRPRPASWRRRKIANLDEQKQAITVRDLAGMMNGMESGCLSGDEPTLNAMRSQPDWLQAALDRNMKQEPGKRFCYDSPGMHLLSGILQETTGMTELEFARQNLFEPLGIREVYWESDPQGYTHGWGDLQIKPRDAAKLAYLWLHQRMWDGKQIVPAEWVSDAVQVHSQTGQADDYGYGWWVSDRRRTMTTAALSWPTRASA